MVLLFDHVNEHTMRTVGFTFIVCSFIMLVSLFYFHLLHFICFVFISYLLPQIHNDSNDNDERGLLCSVPNDMNEHTMIISWFLCHCVFIYHVGSFYLFRFHCVFIFMFLLLLLLLLFLLLLLLLLLFSLPQTHKDSMDNDKEVCCVLFPMTWMNTQWL